ncbi:MAG: hypothetical protein JXB47_04720 [Anaerolineae bacterium]|nr:hypothetical protein [Anaerolineae bacterium]
MTRPEEAVYEVEHDQIASITLTSVSDAGGIELYIDLHDGSVYSFTAYTPAQLDRLMDRNRWLSFVDIDTLIVKEPSLEAIMHALTQVLLLGVTHFGVQVSAPQAVEDMLGEDEDPWAGL